MASAVVASESIDSIILHSLTKDHICELHGPLNIFDLRRAYKSSKERRELAKVGLVGFEGAIWFELDNCSLEKFCSTQRNLSRTECFINTLYTGCTDQSQTKIGPLYIT